MAAMPFQRRIARWVIAAVLTLPLAAPIAACRSAPTLAPAAAPPVERPADFVLAATVHAPANAAEAQLPRSLRPARYVVEVDGSLRAAIGHGSGEQTYPPITRVLTPRQADQLWRLVRDSGLLDPAHPGRVGDPASIPRPGNRFTALIWISYADQATALRVPLDRSPEWGLPAEQLIDRLADWAWVR